jgi:hypothetical protein
MPAKARQDKRAKEHVEEEEKPVEENGIYIFEAHENATYDGQVQRKQTDNIIRRHGRGTYTDKHFSFTGDWKDDTPNGENCVIKFASGASYEGTVIEGKFEGKGTYTWPDRKTVYNGQWRANRMHGEGTYTDSNGVVWTGRFYNGTGPGLRQPVTSTTKNNTSANNRNDVGGNQLQ